ncbi:hypothetical protein ALC60_02753 [Trachymyrmex zeteki]|uniref:Uncharacterized protein n=1 Tax=Mycetomoellerius zeteki TaxID=64791 RepID=A0A151XDA9_9HYME|nr:hypothetical protein ALC60_02753 [Trachymyrmex zeteki]
MLHSLSAAFNIHLLRVILFLYIATDIKGPHCFHFTWPGPSHAEVNKLDCEEHNEKNPFTPCIEPLFFHDTKPNVTKLWENINKNNNTKYIQRMQPGYVCVSYTFMYNGADFTEGYTIETKHILSTCFNSTSAFGKELGATVGVTIGGGAA